MINQATIMSANDLGEYLAREIRQRGWSQRGAAAKLGMAPTTLNNMIHGRYSPDLATLRKIADGLSVSVVALIEMAGIRVRPEAARPPGAYDELTDLDRAFLDSLSADELRDIIDYSRRQRERLQRSG